MASLRGPRRRLARSASDPALRPQIPMSATFSSAAKAKNSNSNSNSSGSTAAAMEGGYFLVGPAASSSGSTSGPAARAAPSSSSSSRCWARGPGQRLAKAGAEAGAEAEAAAARVLAEAKGQRISQLPRPCRERLEGVLVRTLKANYGDSIPLRRPGESQAKTLVERIDEEVAEFSSSAALTAANLRRLQRRVAQHAAMRIHETLSPSAEAGAPTLGQGSSFSRATEGPNAYSDGSSTLLLANGSRQGRPKSADILVINHRDHHNRDHSHSCHHQHHHRHHEGREDPGQRPPGARPKRPGSCPLGRRGQRSRVRCGLPDPSSGLPVAMAEGGGGDEEEAVQDFLRAHCQDEAIAEKVRRSVEARLRARAKLRGQQGGGSGAEREKEKEKEKEERRRRGGGGGGAAAAAERERGARQQGKRKETEQEENCSQADFICGEQWAGPRAPAKVITPNKTSVLPDGKMRLNGTTSGDLGRNQRPEDLATRAENKSLTAGTSVMPGGPMAFYGTTLGELGNMYVWLGDKHAQKKTWSCGVNLDK